FFAHASVAQPICDTISSALTKQFDAYTPGQFKKISKQKKLDPVVAFQIATYFRHKADTTYKQWYQLFINLAYRQHTRGIHYKDKTPRFSQYKIYLEVYFAEAFYFIGNYKQACNWFYRAYKYKISCPCLDYYFEDVKKRNGISTE
ncbi:MAG: hypothetical protein WCL06_15030, partial [Bacteroidota bacterium]